MGASLSSEQDHYAVGAARGGIQEKAEADAAAAAMLADSGLSTRVELSISCENLRNKDGGVWGTSDAMVVVYMQRDGAWREIGRTEVIANTVNPTFVKLIAVDYHFEEIQVLGFKVYDADSDFSSVSSEGLDLSKQDYLGEVSCALAEIMGGAGQTLRRRLTDRGSPSTDAGMITISGEEVANQNNVLRVQFKATGLPRMDFLGLSDPFLIINRVREGPNSSVSKVPVFRTEVKVQTLNPTWRITDIPINSLCNNDVYRPLIIDCFDWDADGKHDYIGTVETSVAQLLELASPRKLQDRSNHTPILCKKKQRGTAKVHGMLIVSHCEVIQRPSFLDFIAGGCQMNFMVAVDFTASNGAVHQPGSLHYLDSTGFQLNSYQQAIVSVGEVLQFYDSDKRYPLWGFGGKAAGGVPNHCFALNGDDANPEVAGVQGILDAYAVAVSNVQLSGPTIFSNVINTAASIAASTEAFMSQDQQQYFVLLIITDGIINDMDNTISAIVAASKLPLSILIVGVGNADFTAMNVLDGDDVRLSNHTGVAARDIVQFVAMRDFNQGGAINVTNLSRSLLDEIPRQLLTYFESKGIHPNPRPAPQPIISDSHLSPLSMSLAQGQTLRLSPRAPLPVAPSVRFNPNPNPNPPPYGAPYGSAPGIGVR